MTTDDEWLSIDYNSCSPSQLVSLIQELEGGKHDGVRLALQGELVNRLRTKGLSERRIIEELLRGVGTAAKRNKIAKEWAPVFGITTKAFKNTVSGN